MKNDKSIGTRKKVSAVVNEKYIFLFHIVRSQIRVIDPNTTAFSN